MYLIFFLSTCALGGNAFLLACVSVCVVQTSIKQSFKHY